MFLPLPLVELGQKELLIGAKHKCASAQSLKSKTMPKNNRFTPNNHTATKSCAQLLPSMLSERYSKRKYRGAKSCSENEDGFDPKRK